MIKNESYSLLNRRISNDDMTTLCQIFEEKQFSFKCHIFLEDGKRYTFKYNKNKKEQNPFKTNFFKNSQISTIIFESKICTFEYGADSDNIIIFEGDENDDIYQYFFTKIDAWMLSLKKLKRIKLTSSLAYASTYFLSSIIIVSLCILYGFLSSLVSENMLVVVCSSLILCIFLFTATLIYFSAFLPYEIKIGICKYKKMQNVFYTILTACVIPLLLGLVL